MRWASSSVRAAGVVVLVAGYVLLAQIGQWLGEFDTLTVFYLPAGLALGAGLILGWRAWPVLAVAEFVGGIVVFGVDDTFSLAQMVVNAAGYAATYVFAASILRRAGIVTRADRLREALQVLVIGVVLAPLLAATFGVAMQVWADLAPWDDYWTNVRIWWVGDAVGVATLAPALMVAALCSGVAGPRFVPPSLRRSPPVATIAELASPSIVATVVVVAGDGRPGTIAIAFAPLALVALRAGVAGAALAALALGPTMTVLANEFVDAARFDRTDLQILLLAMFVMGFLIGVVVDERERAGQRHRELAAVVETATDFVTMVRHEGTLEYVNPAGRRLAGLGDDVVLEGIDETDLYAPGTSRELVEEARRAAERNGSWRGDVMLRGPDGTEIPASKVVIAHYGSDHTPLRTTSLIRDVTDEHRLRLQLEQRSVEDALTGLPNRTYFQRELERRRNQFRRDGVSGVVLVLKLDRFNIVMEGFGSDLGDAALRELAQRWVLVAGSDVLVARLEGATFGILPDHPMTEPEGALVGQRLVEAAAQPLFLDGRTVPMSASVGVAEIDGARTTAAELVRRADVAAHRAQGLGGAQVICHEESMSDAARAAFTAEARLRAALHDGTWWLEYQPIATAGTLEIVSAEALLRFEHGGSPYPMVILAEELGLIVPMGEQILRRALRDAAAWPDRDPSMRVNVNVSRRQLMAAGFCESVLDALSSCSLDPTALTVEITETAATADPAVTGRVLADLRAAGVWIALDDFGTGQSSLATLDRLPIDVVKLDREFTVSLPDSARTQAVAHATIELAHSLDLLVVAEGVEDDVQHRLLVEMGCDRIQGYLMARPMPPDRFAGLLGQR